MKKYLKITLITVLVLIILLALLLFTQTGNDLVKPYLKAELEKQIGLPTKVETFKLRYDHTVLDIIIDKGLKVDVASDFNLLTQSFDGTYKVSANNFLIKGISLKELNINGEYKGVPDDLRVNGKGTSFNAPLSYDLRVLGGEAKEITFYIREFAAADILDLAKLPALAQGMVDANLSIPSLPKENLVEMLEAKLNVNLDNITFNEALVKEVYHVVLPKSLAAEGKINANLAAKKVVATVDMQSKVANTELANVNLNNLKVNIDTKHVNTDYVVDVLDLKSLSTLLHTKLDGVLLLKGHVEKTDTLNVTGSTNSLGGEISYALADKAFVASLEAMPMQNMLKMFSFPPFVDANTSGKFNYNLLTKKGQTALALDDFKLASNSVTKSLGTIMPMSPTDIVFGGTSLDATIDGDEVVYNLMAKASEASISIGEGKINRADDTHQAKIEFGFNKYAIAGTVGGSIRHPRVGFDTKGFLKDQMMDNDFADRAEKELKRFFKRLF